MPSPSYLDGTYAEQNPTWHAEDSPWKAAQILKAIGLSKLAPNSIAEVGCGAGGILAELSKHLSPASFFGYDISPQAIEFASQHRGITFRLGSLPDESFDLVLAIDVIEHVEDVFGFLRKLRQHGKTFIFHIPLDMTVHGVSRNIAMVNRRAFGHLHYFSRETALVTLQDSGYSIDRWFYTPTVDLYPRSVSNLLRKATFAMNENLAAVVLGGYSVMVVCR